MASVRASGLEQLKRLREGLSSESLAKRLGTVAKEKDASCPGIQFTIKTMGAHFTTIAYLRSVILHIGSLPVV